MPEASRPSGRWAVVRPSPGAASARSGRPGAGSQTTPPPVGSVISSPSGVPSAPNTWTPSSTWFGSRNPVTGLTWRLASTSSTTASAGPAGSVVSAPTSRSRQRAGAEIRGVRSMVACAPGTTARSGTTVPAGSRSSSRPKASTTRSRVSVTVPPASRTGSPAGAGGRTLPSGWRADSAVWGRPSSTVRTPSQDTESRSSPAAAAPRAAICVAVLSSTSPVLSRSRACSAVSQVATAPASRVPGAVVRWARPETVTGGPPAAAGPAWSGLAGS